MCLVCTTHLKANFFVNAIQNDFYHFFLLKLHAVASSSSIVKVLLCIDSVRVVFI